MLLPHESDSVTWLNTKEEFSWLLVSGNLKAGRDSRRLWYEQVSVSKRDQRGQSRVH